MELIKAIYGVKKRSYLMNFLLQQVSTKKERGKLLNYLIRILLKYSLEKLSQKNNWGEQLTLTRVVLINSINLN